MAALLGRTDEDFESSDDTGDGRAPLIKPESKKYGSDGDLEVPINSQTTGVMEDDLVSVRLRARSREEGSEEERPEQASPRSTEARQDEDSEEKETCGLVYCYKKLLDQLPRVGDDNLEESSAEFEESLRFGAWQIVQLIIPVCICMVVVVILQLTIAVYDTSPQQKLLYLPYSENSSSGGINFLFGVVNAIVFVALVLVMTIVLVLLFKYRCDKAIFVWLFMASGLLLFFISALYFIQILLVRDLVIDWFTFALVLWNFGCLGLMVIHWKGPLRIQQVYLIVCSALVATVLIRYIPDWTTWIILAGISIYDLFAVLCKKGPLRVLVETAKERGEINFPSLIYSSTMVWVIGGMADNNKKSDDKKSDGSGNKSSGRKKEDLPKQRPQKAKSPQEDGEGSSSNDEEEEGTDREEAARELNVTSDQDTRGQSRRRQGGEQEEEEEEDKEEKRGFKLGLGDFIFYSVLVGKAAHQSNGDWIIISSCFVAILIGLCVTSLILGIVRRALPALPFSIFFGLIFYFTSQYIISPYVQVLNVNQVFI